MLKIFLFFRLYHLKTSNSSRVKILPYVYFLSLNIAGFYLIFSKKCFVKPKYLMILLRSLLCPLMRVYIVAMQFENGCWKHATVYSKTASLVID